jgi:predicted DNA-binding transcriptional regulator AlpA
VVNKTFLKQKETLMHLSGMKEICNHLNRSEPTVLTLIRDYDFPAKKVLGVWESDTDLIDRWRKNQISRGNTSVPMPNGGVSPAARKKQRKAGRNQRSVVSSE